LNASEVIAALDLPASCRIDQRVPKKLLVENGAPTAADKRHINEGIDELLWVAALKPTTIGVPEYRDEVREYLEIAVLRLTLRAGTKAELTHRAVPYPVFLVTDHGEHPSVTMAHKRWSQGERARPCSMGRSYRLSWTSRFLPTRGLPSWRLSPSAVSLAQRFLNHIAAGSTRCAR